MEGKKVLEGFKYTEKHEWVKVEGDLAIFGISDYAQHSLGDIVFIDFSAVGKELKKGDGFGTIESVKAADDLYAPIGGEISEVNSELTQNPAVINENPYDSWMIKVKNFDKSQFEELMDHSKYGEFLKDLE